MKIITSFVLLGAFMVSASSVQAATYMYVATNGDLKSIEASSPSEAIRSATDIAYNSGVMSPRSTTDITTTVTTNTPTETVVNTGKHLYMYVDRQGELKTQLASSPTEAIALAPNRMPSSGVLLIVN